MKMDRTFFWEGGENAGQINAAAGGTVRFMTHSQAFCMTCHFSESCKAKFCHDLS